SGGVDGRRSLAHASFVRRYMQTCGTWTSSYRLVLGLLQELDIKPEFAPAEILDDRASTEQDARWDVVFTRIAALQEYGWHAAIQEMLWATDTLNGALTEMDWDRLEPELGRVRARWTDEIIAHAEAAHVFFPAGDTP